MIKIFSKHIKVKIILVLLPFVTLGAFLLFRNIKLKDTYAGDYLEVTYNGNAPPDPVFTLDDMKPGDSEERCLTVKNKSIETFSVDLTGILTFEDKSFPQILEFSVYDSLTNEIVFEGLLADFFSGSPFDMGNISAGSQRNFCAQVNFPSSAGNEYQEAVAHFDLEFSTNIPDIELPPECKHLEGTITSVIEGTEGNDKLEGTHENELIIAYGGNDKIKGGAGNDCIWAGEGNNNVNGDSGHDVIVAGEGNNNIDGSAGEDQIYAGDGNNRIRGGSGNDTIIAGNGKNTINGESGNDQIYAGDGGNNVRGDAGDDYIETGSGKDDIRGGSGDDEIHAGSGNDNVRGNSGHDTIFGDDGDDNLRGNTGDDTIDGGNGDDNIDGGTGTDTCTNGTSYSSCEL